MTTLLPNAKQQFFDANGVPLAGGSVYFYIPGTTTFKNTWQDASQVTLNTNPVILDSAGEAVIFGAGAYRQILFDALSNQIWDQLTASTDTAGVYSGGTSAGTANNQVIVAPSPSGFALTAGNLITFVAGFTNTGAATLNANGTGAKSIFKAGPNGPVALSGGEIVVNNAVELFYDGTQYQIIGNQDTALVRTGTTVNVINTVATTTVLTSAVPANTLGTSRQLRLRVLGDYINSSGANSNLQVQVFFGGTTLLETGASFAQASNANRRSLSIDMTVGANGASNAQFSIVFFSIGNAAGDTGGASTAASVFQQGVASAIDTTLPQNIIVRFTHSVAAATIDARLYNAVVTVQ